MSYSTHLASEIEALIGTGGRLRTSARVLYYSLGIGRSEGPQQRDRDANCDVCWGSQRPYEVTLDMSKSEDYNNASLG